MCLHSQMGYQTESNKRIDQTNQQKLTGTANSYQRERGRGVEKGKWGQIHGDGRPSFSKAQLAASDDVFPDLVDYNALSLLRSVKFFCFGVRSIKLKSAQSKLNYLIS